VCVIDQTEQFFLHALSAPLHERLLRQLRAPTLEVLRLDGITADAMPTFMKPRAELTDIGRTVLERMTLEMERRYCNNKTENLTGNRLIMKYAEMLSTMIDPRTMTCLHLPDRRRKQRRDMYMKKLTDAYEVYAKKALAWYRGAAADEADDEEVDDEDDDKNDEAEGDDDESEAHRPAPLATGFSDDEDEDMATTPSTRPSKPPAAAVEPPRDWKEEFKTHYKNHRIRCAQINWRTEFPELNLPAEGELSMLDDLVHADLTKIMNRLIDEDPDRSRFGFIPHMATGFEGSVASLLASSFSERVNSCANLVLTDGNSLLGHDEMGKLVVLRMNRGERAAVMTNGHESRANARASSPTVCLRAQNS
jgi:hypothetical protein